MLSRLGKLFLSIFVISTLFVGTANAQLSLEKLAIAKSKLTSPIWKKHDPASKIEVDHDRWDAFLKKYTRKDGRGVNRVAYGRVSSADQKILQNYLNDLQKVDVTKLNRNEQYAFWLNLYNASTVNIGIKNFPINSILDVKKNVLDLKGPFNDVVARVNGKKLTLDNIESGVVRPVFNDPRLHYAFNCAAVSCPNLGSKAYRGKTLNAVLDRAARSYVNDPRGVRISNGEITVSKIYFWYDVDFGGSEKSILNHIRQYANAGLKKKLAGKTSIDNYEYIWDLNTL